MKTFSASVLGFGFNLGKSFVTSFDVGGVEDKFDVGASPSDAGKNIESQYYNIETIILLKIVTILFKKTISMISKKQPQKVIVIIR